MPSLPLDGMCYHRQRYCPPSNTNLFMFGVIPWVPCYPAIVLLYLGVLPSFMSRMFWDLFHLLRILDIEILSPSPFFLGPRVNSNKWTVLFGFFPSSNPIFFEVNGRRFILRLLTIESPFWHWSCNPTHISGAPFNQCLIGYFLLEYTSLYYLIWQMLFRCSHNCGNPSFGNLGELPLSSPDTSLSSPWVNDGLLITEITS